MRIMRHIFVFIANDISRLRRKWLTLPLIFISPLIFIGLLLWIMSSVFMPDEPEDIEIGLVNLDDSEPASMIVSALADSAEVAEGLEINEMTQAEAEEMIGDNTLVSYILFPEKFTDKMMRGESSQLEVVGNPDMQLESYVISGVIDTVVRHIRNSQANILTINHYAETLGMSDEEREALIFQEFVNQFIQVLSSDTLMDEHEISQNISAGAMYFIVNGLFILMTVWVYMLHIALMRDTDHQLKERIKLAGGTYFVQGAARSITTSVIVSLFSILLMLVILKLSAADLPVENIGRLAVLMILHIIITSILLIISGWLIRSFKISMTVQLFVILLVILFAGSIIPRIYFPVYLDPVFDYMYSYQTLFWMEELLLNGRFIIETEVLLITLAVLFVVFLAAALYKERRFL